MLPHQVRKPQMQGAFRKAQFLTLKSYQCHCHDTQKCCVFTVAPRGHQAAGRTGNRRHSFEGTGEGASNCTPNHTAYTLEMPCTL